MAINLVSQITEFFTPDMIGRIASVLGLDRGSAQKAIGASIPGLLAGLVGLSGKPEGARQLASELDQQPSSMFDSFKNLTSAAQPALVTQNGSSMLSNLLGGRTLSGLASAVGSFAGIGSTASTSLLGAIAPMVLGGVAQEQRSRGLDSNGLANFLATQKDNISAAIPSGFGNLLGGTGLLDAVGGVVGAGSAAAAAAANRARAGAGEAAYAARRVADDVRERAPSSNWLYWVIPLVVLAGIAWYFLSNQGQVALNQAGKTATEATQAIARAPNLTVQGVDLSDQFTNAVGGVRTALQSIMDPTSAQAAVPQLQAAAAQLDNVTGLANQLPSESRKALAQQVAMDIPSLNQSFDTVLANADVAAVVQPEIDGLKNKLRVLANS